MPDLAYYHIALFNEGVKNMMTIRPGFIVIVSLSITACSNSNEIDASFLQVGGWVSSCKVFDPEKLLNPFDSLSNIIETVTYKDAETYSIVAKDFSDADCTVASGYTASYSFVYSLGQQITTSDGVTAYTVNTRLVTMRLQDTNTSGTTIFELVPMPTVLDILKVENNILYFGINATPEKRANALDFNAPYTLSHG